MDFLQIFPDEICENILCYLAPKDILAASMVSKSWYERIGKSKASMKKITLAYYGDLDKDVNPVLNSKRAYTKVKFLVKRSKLNRRIENIYRLILNKFSDSITNLDTSHDTIRTSLPKLKEVFFRNYFCSYFDQMIFYKNGLLSTSNFIESFGIYCIHVEGKSLKILKAFLQNMTKLRVFRPSLYGILYDWKDWFNHQFKLEEFYFRYNVDFDSLAHEFLLAHNSTLKFIHMMYLKSDVLASILSDFPQLITLKFNDIIGTAKPYPVNKNITTLIIDDKYTEEFDLSEHLDSLIPSLPNLQVLNISKMSISNLMHVNRCQSLKRLVYFSIYGNDYTEVPLVEALLSDLSRRVEVMKIKYKDFYDI